VFSCFCSGACASLFCSAFGPWCWPCLISKIAARVNWDPELPACLGGWRGRTPHQQWLRILSVMCVSYFVFMILHCITLPEVAYETEDFDEEMEGGSARSNAAGDIPCMVSSTGPWFYSSMQYGQRYPCYLADYRDSFQRGCHASC
jgi:hypothetical protein